MGTISTVTQAVELILALWLAFNVLSTPMLIISSSFHCFSWKSTQPALFNCVALGALKSFIKFTRKHLWQSHFFDNLANYRLAALLKKRLQQWCFHVNAAASMWIQQFSRRRKTTVSVIKLVLKQVSKMTADEYLDLNIEEIVLHPFTASSFFSSFFRSFISFCGILTFVKVHLELSFIEFSFKDYSTIY